MSNDEEIIDDDDELIPQIPQTFEKKIPQMTKYFSDRTRGETSSYATLYSFLSSKSVVEKEKKQKNQKAEQEATPEEEEDKFQPKYQQKNDSVEIENQYQEIEERKEQQKDQLIEEEEEEEKKQEKEEVQEEEKKKQAYRESDTSSTRSVPGEKQVKVNDEERDKRSEFSFSNPTQTPLKDLIASNIIFSEQKSTAIETPSNKEELQKQQKENLTPTRLFQEEIQKNEQQQQQIVQQRVSTESTQASAQSQIVTVFQMPSNTNGYNQCGSHTNSLSNTSFTSTQNDQNISQMSTKPSDISLSESISRQEIEEVANKIKKLTVKERKIKELAIVKEWNQEKYSSHIIDISWAVSYTKWFQDQQTVVPFNNPISNYNLIDIQNKTIKQGIKEKINFDIVSTRVYFLMKCLYGGGPDIPLTRQSTSNKSINDTLKSNHMKQHSSLSGTGDPLFTKQSSSASTAATNPSLLEQHFNQSKMPLSIIENQMITQQVIIVRPSALFKKFHLGVKGLHNQSNYCYLNASIQCLLSIPEMNGYFLSDEYKRIVKLQATRKALRLVPVFADMVKMYEKTSDKSILDMNLLKKTIRKPFIPHEQHDAQELIRYILSEIQDELNPLLPSKNPIQFDDSEAAYKYYLKYQNSIIDYIFSGQLSSNVHCSKCGQISKTFDPFLDLSLGMDGTSTIQDCLSKFFSEEILSDDYKCERCNQNNKAKKQVLISKTPYILTLHLKRFKAFPKKKKISDFIKYPLQNLSIKPYLKGGSQCGQYYYNLIGIIVHSGSQDSGHYVSFVKRDNRWFCCDDGRFQEVSEKVIIKQEAYLLFYQRIDESSQNIPSAQVKKQ